VLSISELHYKYPQAGNSVINQGEWSNNLKITQDEGGSRLWRYEKKSANIKSIDFSTIARNALNRG
jgi:hypothetical protein